MDNLQLIGRGEIINKREIRIKVLNLQGKHCKECNRCYSKQGDYCWRACEVGKSMNQLGICLGGRHGLKVKKQRTTQDWDKFCVKAAAMREAGMTYKKIAEVLKVSEGSQITFQLKK